MECLTAQQLIEAARPDADDLSSPELEVAAAHLRECPVCSAAWETARFRDRAIARTMQDVAIPDGLEDRLLMRLGLLETEGMTLPGDSSDQPAGATSAAEEQAEQRSAGVRPGGRRLSRMGRRGMTAALCLVTASLLVGVGFWTWLSTGPEIALADLQQAVPQDLRGTPVFDGNFDSQLPSEFRNRTGLEVSSSPRGLALPQSSRHVAALYAFAVQQPRGVPVQGLLVAIPAGNVDLGERTLAGSFATAAEESIGERAVAVWSDDAFVYLCFVDRHHGSLRDVKQALVISVT